MPLATVPGSRPGLVTVPGVEICRVGTWATSTGVFDFTLDDFAAAIAAERDPEMFAAPLKLGHTDARFAPGDGEPAFGWVRNLRVSGDRLLGDLADMPQALADLLPTAYPRRSVEMGFQVHTPGGARYRAAVVGLALLGVSAPAVSGLADIAGLYDGSRPFQLAAAVAARCSGGVAVLVQDPAWVDARAGVTALAARAGLDPALVLAAVDQLAVMPTASPSAPVSADTLIANAAPTPPGGRTMPLTDARVRELLALEANADTEAALVALRDRAAAATPPPPPAAPPVVPGTGPFLPTGWTPPAPAPVGAPPAAPVAPPAAGVNPYMPPAYQPPAGPMAPPAAPPVGYQPPAGYPPVAPPAPAPAAGVVPPPPAPPVAPAPVATAPPAPPAPPAAPAAPAPAGVAELAAAVAAQLQPVIAAAAAPGMQVAEVMRVRDREAMLAAHARRGALRPADLDYYRGQYDTNPAGTIAHLAAAPVQFPTFEIGSAGSTADSQAASAEADKQFLSSCGITDL